MRNLIARAARFVHDEHGVTAIEYGLLAGLIALLIIGGVTTLGTNLQSIFNNLASSV
ncbi:Flp family type IVb pilin [Paraburkholderia sp. UYCP14C]|uniref:Flp family type IVb pilin n=1 Tax=Paraburkholderia sp. UYCP14C TaxID=2511130 RepID=UPI00101FD34F|nr:Flp family type IVb pilin [Paraburkholderia sp. UYCP14C]RZF25050.1 Flp family type IVb pilin [Paraburkholderia sp. UYCP14C]